MPPTTRMPLASGVGALLHSGNFEKVVLRQRTGAPPGLASKHVADLMISYVQRHMGATMLPTTCLGPRADRLDSSAAALVSALQSHSDNAIIMAPVTHGAKHNGRAAFLLYRTHEKILTLISPLLASAVLTSFVLRVAEPLGAFCAQYSNALQTEASGAGFVSAAFMALAYHAAVPVEKLAYATHINTPGKDIFQCAMAYVLRDALREEAELKKTKHTATRKRKTHEVPTPVPVGVGETGVGTEELRPAPVECPTAKMEARLDFGQLADDPPAENNCSGGVGQRRRGSTHIDS